MMKMGSFQPPENPTPEDYSLFGKNVRLRRLEIGWTMKELAAHAGIGLNTLIRIQRGEPCSLRTRERLASAMGVMHKTLWSPHFTSYRPYSVFTNSNTRWFFAEREDAKHWALNEGEGITDPEAIQDPQERLRLGRNGLSCGFMGNRSGLMRNGFRRAGLMEIYGEGVLEKSWETFDVYLHCLKGTLEIDLEDEVMVLQEGDALLFDARMRYRHRPASNMDKHSLPALITWVIIESGQTKSERQLRRLR